MGKGLIVLGGVVALLVALGVFTYLQGQKPGQYDAFAKCLTANDVKMFGAYWCPHCADQKDMFGRSFQYVTYVECAVRGSSVQTAVCREEGIASYPTWEFADGSKVQGVLQLNDLAQRSGCALPP